MGTSGVRSCSTCWCPAGGVDGDLDVEFVGKPLQLAHPQPHARAVAAAAVSGDDQPRGLGGAGLAHLVPPAPDGLHRKRRRVRVHADSARVGAQVVNAIGHRAAKLLDQDVMHPHLFRCSLRAPLAAWVAERADQLLLGVHRDHRLARGQGVGHVLADVAELRVPVRDACRSLGGCCPPGSCGSPAD